MATSSKQPRKLPAKAKPATPKTVKRPVKASSKSSEPFLRFYHSKSLRAKTLAVLTALEKANDATKHRDALAAIIVELTDAGMDYFFLRALKLAKTGFFTQQSANLGMSATTGVLGSVIRTVIGGMDSSQLLTVCKVIRDLME